jgi:hypothetical protein
MKVIGGISMAVAVLLLAVYVAAWIALVAEHGAAEAVRLGLLCGLETSWGSRCWRSAAFLAAAGGCY